MKYFQNQDGLTMVETIIALVLVLLLVTAFAGALTAGLQREIEVDQSLKSADIAASIMEYLGESDDREIVKDIYDNYNGEILLSEFLNVTDFIIEGELDFLEFDSDHDGNKIVAEPYNDENYIYKATVVIEWQERGRYRSQELISLLMVEPDND